MTHIGGKMKIIKINDEYASIVQGIIRSAYLPLLEKYHDEEQSPANKTIGQIVHHINNEDAYLLQINNENVGYVRIKQRGIEEYSISDLAIRTDYQNKGYAQYFLKELENKYTTAKKWSLVTILEESKDCHLYEKLGYIQQCILSEVSENMHMVLYAKKVKDI